MKKYAVVVVIILVLVCSLCSCSTDVSAQSDTQLGTYVYDWVDRDTGVHYIYNARGGMSVRYNSDGTIMCD